MILYIYTQTIICIYTNTDTHTYIYIYICVCVYAYIFMHKSDFLLPGADSWSSHQRSEVWAAENFCGFWFKSCHVSWHPLLADGWTKMGKPSATCIKYGENWENHQQKVLDLGFKYNIYIYIYIYIYANMGIEWDWSFPNIWDIWVNSHLNW